MSTPGSEIACEPVDLIAQADELADEFERYEPREDGRYGSGSGALT